MTMELNLELNNNTKMYTLINYSINYFKILVFFSAPNHIDPYSELTKTEQVE